MREYFNGSMVIFSETADTQLANQKWLATPLGK
jgi:hypothetical protein